MEYVGDDVISSGNREAKPVVVVLEYPCLVFTSIEVQNLIFKESQMRKSMGEMLMIHTLFQKKEWIIGSQVAWTRLLECLTMQFTD